MRIFWELRGFFRRHWRSYATAGAMLFGIAVLGLVTPAVIGRVVDGILQGTLNRTTLVLHALVIAVCGASIYTLRIWWRRILYGASYAISMELRGQIYAHLLTLSPQALRNYSVGDVMARATNDVQAVEMTAGEAVLSIFDGPTTGILVLGVMVFGFSGSLTLMALAPWPLMSWAMWLLGTQLHKRFDVAQAAFSHLNTVAQESIAGIRAVRGLGAEVYASELMEQASQRANAANLRVARIDSRYDPIIYLTVGASFLISIGGGAWLIEQGRLSVGGLTSFTLYLGHLVWPMFAFGWMANLVQRGKAAHTRIQEFLNTPSAVDDRGLIQSVTDIALEVSIDGFCYPDRVQAALQDIHFSLQPGHTIGIVGPTGSGKSTLLALIARFYDADGVRIRLGPLALPDYSLQALRGSVAYVMQEPVLFSASLRDNLLLGRSDASDAEVLEAIRQACFAADVAELPQGLETEVGERGVTLSGGQRQRLCLARALLSTAPILLLDDALSAVDAETEHRILNELETRTRHLSRVIVSHRLSAVQGAAEILVLRDGCVVERGRHAALLEANGWYAATWRYQQLEVGHGV